MELNQAGAVVMIVLLVILAIEGVIFGKVDERKEDKE